MATYITYNGRRFNLANPEDRKALEALRAAEKEAMRAEGKDPDAPKEARSVADVVDITKDDVEVKSGEHEGKTFADTLKEFIKGDDDSETPEKIEEQG